MSDAYRYDAPALIPFIIAGCCSCKWWRDNLDIVAMNSFIFFFFFFGFYFLLSFVLYIKYLLLIHYHTKECIIMQLFDVLNVINILIVVFCACLSKG